MIEKIISLIGKTIDKEEVKQFIEESRLKYPKKDTISLQASERQLSINGKKQGLYLSFELEDFSPLIPVAAGRKGVYYPNLIGIAIESNKENNKLELPLGLKFGMTFDQVQQQLGEPTFDRRNNPHSGIGGCSWHITLKENPDNMYYDAILYVNVGKPEDFTLNALSIRTKQWADVFPLNYPLEGKSVYKDWSKPSYATRFVEWAIKRNFFVETSDNKAGIAKVLKGDITGLEFVKDYIKYPAIYRDEFVPQIQDFVYGYTHRLRGNDIWYKTDINYLYENLGDDYNQEAVEKVIDQRLEEFKPERYFVNSKQLG